MSLQDDYFELDAQLKGEQKRKLRRIWGAFCQAEAEADSAAECVKFVNTARRLLMDKPALDITRGKDT